MNRLLGFLLFLALLLAVAVAGAIGWLHRTVPRSSERQAIAAVDGGPRARVTIAYDALGVPTIRAENERDLAFGQGWAHARDRRFQMELFRRTAMGRLSEVLGSGLLNTDRYFRRFGFTEVATRSVEMMPDSIRRTYEAYAAGVRAWDRTHPSAPEFAVLGVSPAGWQPVDCVLVGLLMHDDLDGGDRDEEKRVVVMDATLPPSLVAFLRPTTTSIDVPMAPGSTPPVPPTPTPADVDLRKRSALGADVKDARLAVRDPFAEEESRGSNNWAIAPSRTATGGAIVAGDPHLALRVPVIWHRERLVSPAFDALAITLPGVPGVVFGSNGRVAWGGTNVEGDFVDLVRLVPVDGDTTRYRVPGGSEPIGVRREVIHVRGVRDDTLEVRTSRFGPVLDRAPDGTPLALQWTALDPVLGVVDLFSLAHADSLADLFARLDAYTGPPLNIVAGDSRGHIGFRVAGRVPRRAGYDSRRPRDSDLAGAGWFGWLGSDSLPQTIDPPSGFVATANQRTAGEPVATWIGGAPTMPWRVHRIAGVLESRKDWTAARAAALQNDVDDAFLVPTAEALAHALESDSTALDSTLARARDVVRSWTHRADTTSVAHGFLRQARVALQRRLVEPLVAPCMARDSSFVYDWTLGDEVVRRLLTERPAHLLDPEYADYDVVVRCAARDAAAALEKRVPGARFDRIPWGRLNRADIGHPLARAIPPLGRWLDMPHAALAGGSLVVRVAQPRSGASMRMVVDLADASRSTFALPGGQSGNFLSKNYGDGFAGWVAGTTVPFVPGAVRDSVVLEPGP